MSEQSKNPTHYRLLSTLKAIGPYLREAQCEQGKYLFDCLSVCVNDKKSPEEREFWGWWLELEQEERRSKQNTESVYMTLKVIGWMRSCLKKR